MALLRKGVFCLSSIFVLSIGGRLRRKKRKYRSGGPVGGKGADVESFPEVF